MKKYQSFIEIYKTDLKEYYKKLIEIKQNLRLTTITETEFNINQKPKLIIVDTYKKMTNKREERIHDIKKLLETNNIDYRIIK